MKDKNAEKRYTYDLKIMEKERESEELHIQERQLKQSLENFEQDITRSFQTITAIEDELNRRNHSSSGFSETEQKRRYLAQVISTQQETQDLQFKRLNQKLEDERENLLKERNDLAWD
ncbi:hypothetical protein FACS1894193_12460 [Bacilli bacterium]|nr:hypothetical protein FACS1894192_11380 [Bacilli bacterium]GHU44276.1 hypothetical protein FACS1894193_12460 [Bacilli bacterium]GHU45856.1 hypothetical protein FACS1894194_2490 [Bacilli bacterium]